MQVVCLPMMTFEDVWKSMIALQGDHVFHTARGLPYTFIISSGVIKLSRKANPITRATVEVAYRNAVHGAVPGPKALRCFGASYLYPIFVEIGVINSNRVDEHTREEEEVMPRPKGSRNKPALTIDEQITQATAKVEELRTQLEAAEAELKTLTALRDEEQVKELMSAIASSGKSVSDVIAMLKGE